MPPSSSPHDHPEFAARYELARRAAFEAGQSTLRYFRGEFEIDHKSDDTPVTVADREAELLVRRMLAEHFPDDSILGEEFDDIMGTTPFRWIIDPIDGTKSFVSGVPLYATLVGIEFEGRGVVGVIELPALGECVYAAEGQGAWSTVRGGKPTAAAVGDFASLSAGLFVTSERITFDERDAGDTFRCLESAARTTRTWGDAYGYALVATGRAVAMIDPLMQVWDAAAVQPILREAGGIFTDWQGEPTIHGGEGIGTVPSVLPEILEITRRAKRLSV